MPTRSDNFGRLSKFKQKRRGKLSHGVLFHQDNAPAHMSAVAMAEIRQYNFQLLNHPPYSPDLAPSDYHIFLSLKDSLRGQKFNSDEEVIHATNSWFEQQDKNFFVDGVKSLAHRWENVLHLNEVLLKNCKVVCITDDCFYVFLSTY